MPFPPKAHEWSDDAWEVWTVEQVNFGLSPLCPEFRTTPVSGTAEHVTEYTSKNDFNIYTSKNDLNDFK